MAVVSVEKQPQMQVSWVVEFIYKLATRFIDLQCTRAKYPSRFPLKLLQYSAERGHVLAMSGLGRLLYVSGACRAEKRSGLEYVRQAAKASDADAQYVLGEAYFEDDVFTQKNKQLAIHWLALAADNGHTQAAQKLRLIAEQDAEEKAAQERAAQASRPEEQHSEQLEIA